MSGTAAYSTLKAAWHIDRIEQLRQGRQIVPVELQLILSDLCNQACSWCAYRSPNGLSVQNFGVVQNGNLNPNPNRMMSREKAIEIIDDAATVGVKSIIFTGGGEPTVFPGHLEIFSHALGLGLDCSLNTNGCILRPGWDDVLPKMKYVRFSIDAGNADEYGSIRQVAPSNYFVALKNLSLLAKRIREVNSDCILGAGYVVTPDNWQNVREGVGRIKETGARYVRMASMQTTEGMAVYHGDTWHRAVQAVAAAKVEYQDEFFSVVDLTEDAMGKHPDYEFCGFQHFVAYVGANLKVFRCCYTAYTDLGEIGSLENQSFADWIRSSECRDQLFGFDARRCSTCPLDGKNRTILYMIDPSPLHVNFV